jgi:hypothetical protein
MLTVTEPTRLEASEKLSMLTVQQRAVERAAISPE